MARRRGHKKPKDYIWIPSLQQAGNLTSDVPSAITMVEGSDWADSGTGLERATVVSIRGWFTGIAEFTAATNPNIFAYIMSTHEAAATITPDTVAAYSNDILWTYAHTLAFSASESGIQRDWSVEFNVKVRRRIHDQQYIRFATVLSGAGGEFNFVARCLLNRLT